MAIKIGHVTNIIITNTTKEPDKIIENKKSGIVKINFKGRTHVSNRSGTIKT